MFTNFSNYPCDISLENQEDISKRFVNDVKMLHENTNERFQQFDPMEDIIHQDVVLQIRVVVNLVGGDVTIWGVNYSNVKINKKIEVKR